MDKENLKNYSLSKDQFNESVLKIIEKLENIESRLEIVEKCLKRFSNNMKELHKIAF